nr:transposase [Thiothrix nivea]
MEDSLLELFCDIDDFCQQFVPEWNRRQLASGERQRQRTQQLALSEIMTILVYFHRSSYRCFKHYYLYQRDKLHSAFPELVSYSRFVYLTPTALIPLCAYLMGRRGEQTGISFCGRHFHCGMPQPPYPQPQSVQKVAKRGKTSTGWFYGFKLHLVINDRGSCWLSR